jgi:hypothetical protein
MMTEKILACPYCGAIECEVDDCGNNDWHVYCVCGATGPDAGNESDAVLLWSAASNALAKKDAEIEKLNKIQHQLNAEIERQKLAYTHYYYNFHNAIAERDEALKRLKDCQDMYQLNLECHYDTKERLTAERDEARRVARVWYNSANAWMKNWTELINALPARNEPQSVRVTETSDSDDN